MLAPRRPALRGSRQPAPEPDALMPCPPSTDDHITAPPPRPLTMAELDQWVLFGGTWRTVTLDRRRGVVDLCTCAGEAVDRRESSAPDVLARLAAGE